MRKQPARTPSAPNVMAMVMAGGQGSRLMPLTEKRSKPAVPFGSRYRIVDFVLSNLVNSGIYTVFTASCLVRALRDAERYGGKDFGTDVLPRMLTSKRIFAYNFADNRVPGTKPYEEHAYWRDVGTIDAYFAAHQDVLGDEPALDMFNPQWPVFSSNYQGPVAKVRRGHIDNTLIGAAAVIEDARVTNSIVRREAVIEEGAEVEDCIIMDYTRIGRGARLKHAIIDRHNLIEHGSRIGLDPEEDQRNWIVTPSGIVVVPRGRSPFFARDSRGYGIGYAE